MTYNDCWTYPKEKINKLIKEIIPPFTVADAGKVLKVNEAGTALEWAGNEEPLDAN